MYKTYRDGKYVLLIAENSDDPDHIDTMCELLTRLDIEHHWEASTRYVGLEKLVAYCDEDKWAMLRAYLDEFNMCCD